LKWSGEYWGAPIISLKIYDYKGRWKELRWDSRIGSLLEGFKITPTHIHNGELRIG